MGEGGGGGGVKEGTELSLKILLAYEDLLAGNDQGAWLEIAWGMYM